jgi:hypothetical protein
MSNLVRHTWPKGLCKPVKSTFRVYAQTEPGALLVRQAQAQSLATALNKVARMAEALYWEIREFRNGKERLVHVEEIRL